MNKIKGAEKMTKKKLSQSIMVALDGIAHGVSKERNLKFQFVIGLFIILISILLKIPKTSFIIILFMCFWVIIAELINTSIERLIDLLHPKEHDEIRKIKDMMAGAVLLSVILAIIVGILILYRPIIEFLKTL
jgi:diacylglycerol kinase